MSDLTTFHPFDLTGEFGGIVLTGAGKRRLRLRVGGTERLLKAPRELRRRLIGRFRPGQTIRVSGTEERHDPEGADKWVVSAVLPVDGAANAAGTASTPTAPIRVCAKRDCWRQGGRELYAALEHGLEARGLDGQVRLKAVNCLDRCKQGPNIDWGREEFSRCTLRDAEILLDRIAPAPTAPAASQVPGGPQGTASTAAKVTGAAR